MADTPVQPGDGRANPAHVGAASAVVPAGIGAGDLFAQRLAAFNRDNGEFERLVNGPGHLPDEIANKLCDIASRSYHALIETPCPDVKSVAAKLDAIARWAKDCRLPWEEIVAVAAEARVFLDGEA